MKGLVLSGGSGTRLRPFTHYLPKQLLPVANRPVLFYALDAMVKTGVRQIGIVAGDRIGIIKKTVQETLYPEKQSNTAFSYIFQEKPSGLAHAVKVARPFIKDSDFMMILGDNLFDQEISQALEIFCKQRADALIFLAPVQEPSRYGIAEVKNSHVVSLVEKPSYPKSNLAVMGIYVFSKAIYSAIEQTKPSWRGELEITDAIQKLLDLGGLVVPYHYHGWWIDVGKPDDLLTANRKMLGIISGKKAQGPTFMPENKLFISPTAHVSNSKLISPLIIGDRSHIVNSAIGPFVSIANEVKVINTFVHNSIILEKTCLQCPGITVGGSIIGKNVSIEANQQKNPSIKMFLGDYSLIEDNK